MKCEGRAAARLRGSGSARRRRGFKRLLFSTPPEHSLDYPGFFVLPRASSATHTSPGKQPTHRAWLARFKLSALLLLLFGSFIGTLAYFFSQVAPTMAEPYAEAPPFVSNPKSLPTNSNFGPLQR